MGFFNINLFINKRLVRVIYRENKFQHNYSMNFVNFFHGFYCKRPCNRLLFPLFSYIAVMYKHFTLKHRHFFVTICLRHTRTAVKICLRGCFVL